MAKPPKLLALGTIALTIVFMAALGLGPRVFGRTRVAVAQSNPGSGCSDATFNGSYGFLNSGYQVNGPDGSALASPIPFAVATADSFDGAGNLSIYFRTINTGGAVDQATGTGTYSVNADCSFTASLTLSTGSTTHFSGTLFDSGKKTFSVVTDPGSVITAVGEKMGVGPCSNATLNGNYGFYATGSLLTGSDGSSLAQPLPYAVAGNATFDGAGNGASSVNINSGGTPTQQTRSFTYSVNSDCTFTATVDAGAAGTSHRSGVVVDGGKTMYVIGTDPGAVYAQIVGRQ